MGRREASVAVVAAAAVAATWSLLKRRRRAARLAGHAKVVLLPAERSPVICMSPSTSTITFFHGSIEDAEAWLEDRVAAIVRANPWLAGRLDDDPETGLMALFVPPGAADAKLFEARCDVAVRRDAPYDDIVAAVAAVLCGTSDADRGTAKPLFRVTLLPCADDPAYSYALVVSANHSLLDGHGYYRVHSMLSQGADVEALRPERNADLPPLMTAAMGGETSLLQDAKPGFVARFLVAQLRNALFPATASYGFFVDEAWLAARKGEAAVGVAYVSTNDCLVSDVLRLLGCDVALMAANFRGRVDGCGDDDVGNYEDLIAFTPSDYATPALVRKAIAAPPLLRETRAALPTNVGHLGATYGAVTNWATFAKPLEIPGGDQDLHLPLFDWNQSTPASCFGAMVIFRPSEGATAAFVAGRRDFVDAVKAAPLAGRALFS